jgi:hypothetical protein
VAKNRSSDTALAVPSRWLGGGAVALIHLAFLMAVLLTDHLTFHKTPDGRPMEIYRLPDEAPAYSRQTIQPITPPSSAASAPSSVLAPRLDGPMILIQPEKPLPPNLRGLDLSTKPAGNGIRPLTQDDLLSSKETKLKQFFAESEERNRLDREPPAGRECEAVITSKSNAASLGVDAYHEPLPIDAVCTPTLSAKELSKRNDRFAPQ